MARMGCGRRVARDAYTAVVSVHLELKRSLPAGLESKIMKRFSDLFKRSPDTSQRSRRGVLSGERFACWEAGCMRPTTRYGPDAQGKYPWYCQEHAHAHGLA